MRFYLVVYVALLGALGSGCASFDVAEDCADVCEAMRACGEEAGGGPCTERCRARAGVDDILRLDLDRCAACASGRTCAEAMRSCDACDRLRDRVDAMP